MSRKQDNKSPHTASARPADRPLRAWGARRPDPDWDRYIAALVALALKRAGEDDEEDRG